MVNGNNGDKERDWDRLCFYILEELKKIKLLDNAIRSLEKELAVLKTKIAVYSSTIALIAAAVVNWFFNYIDKGPNP